MSLFTFKKCIPLYAMNLLLTGCGLAPVDIALNTFGAASTMASSRQQFDFSDPQFVQSWNFATMLLENDRERFLSNKPSASDWENYRNVDLRNIDNINAHPELIPLITAVTYHYDRHQLYLDDNGRSRSSGTTQSAEVSLAILNTRIASQMENPDKRQTVWLHYKNNYKTIGLKKLDKDYFEQNLVQLSRKQSAFADRKMQLVSNELALVAEEDRRNTRVVKAKITIEANTTAEKRIQTILNAIPFTESVTSRPNAPGDRYFDLRIGKMPIVLNRFGLAHEINDTMQKCQRLGTIKNDANITTRCLNKYGESIRQWGQAAQLKNMSEGYWKAGYHEAKDSGFFFFSHWTAEAKRSPTL